ncbi:GNAT family N-acetyltransferase [Novosphingobium kunmingense]|nr:N-acetyltransferase [Novosphingobium kunmingense]
MAGLVIRPEGAADRAAIHALTQRAFAAQPRADGDEQDLVDRLRDRGELILSLVAELPGKGVIGHIGFSPVMIDGADRGWVQLAPVSVDPPLHRQGVGSALIEAGVARLRQSGARGIGVVGDPAYYERFGFTVVPGLGPDGPEAAYFRAKVLDDPAPCGLVRYASAFG